MMLSIFTCSVASSPPMASRISPSTLRDAVQHALAAVAGFVAVAQLHRLMRAGRGAGRHRGAPKGAAVQGHVALDGRVAAAVEDFAGGQIDDRGHDGSNWLRAWIAYHIPHCGRVNNRGQSSA